ncbi:hypothetical protein MNB_SM-4-1255 [hydrothermal vent metagenome]|uniref:Spondin domain-containing protein n=1 Tax=hydrothermal vent metagenome TaxID=652676 RepID=A0A1W1CLS5_9ZZZZ
MKISNIIVPTLLLASMVTFSACGTDEDSVGVATSSYIYSVSVTNLTAGQPMSPILLTSNSLFTVGETASLGLEKLAEGGDNSDLVDSNGVSGSGLLTPGSSEILTLTTSSTSLSIATMLVKTNDAFAGVNAYDVSGLAVNANTTFYLNVYDAGTEANSETNTTVAAFGVEGFSTMRDDSDKISIHPGVISNEDGLSTSALTAFEKFNNPVVAVTITRTK